MFHRILFIINRKFLSRFLMDFQVQESEFSCFLSPFFFLSIHLWKIEVYTKRSPYSAYDALIGLRILYTRNWKRGPCTRKWIVGFTCRILYQRGWLHWKWKRNESSNLHFFFFHDRVLYQCSRHKVSHRSTRIPNYAIEDASLSSRDCTIDYNC